MDEGPLVALVPGADGRLQAHVLVVVLLALLGRPLHGAPVGALHTEASPRVAGVPAPAALRLLQALPTRPQTGAVLGYGGRRRHKPTLGRGQLYNL